MKKPFHNLRVALKEKDVDQAYLARHLGCGRSYITSRINAHEPWSLDDCYKLLTLVGHGPESIYEFFPPEGKAG